MLFLIFASCTHQVSVPAVLPDINAHYLVTRDGETVWDCRSYPMGDKWKPTCVKVAFVNSAPSEAEAAPKE